MIHVSTITGTTDIATDGTWYFIAVVYDQSAGTMKLYVDGVEEAQLGVGTINTNTADVYLGSNSTPTQYYELMQEIGIFDYSDFRKILLLNFLIVLMVQKFPRLQRHVQV